MELLLQMLEYEKRGDSSLDLSEFMYVTTKVSLPEMKNWVEEICKSRREYWAVEERVVGEESADTGMKELQDKYYS